MVAFICTGWRGYVRAREFRTDRPIRYGSFRDGEVPKRTWGPFFEGAANQDLLWSACCLLEGSISGECFTAIFGLAGLRAYVLSVPRLSPSLRVRPS